MSSDLYIRSLARGVLIVRRRKTVSGELMVCFHDPAVPTVHITNDDPVVLTELAGVTPYTLQRSNIRNLLEGFLDVVW